jgi:hypothetical protein
MVSYGAGWNGVGAASYLGQAGKGVTGTTLWRFPSVSGSTDGCEPLRHLGIGLTFVVFKVVNTIKRCESRRKSNVTAGRARVRYGRIPEDAVHAAHS